MKPRNREQPALQAVIDSPLTITRTTTLPGGVEIDFVLTEDETVLLDGVLSVTPRESTICLIGSGRMGYDSGRRWWARVLSTRNDTLADLVAQAAAKITAAADMPRAGILAAA